MVTLPVIPASLRPETLLSLFQISFKTLKLHAVIPTACQSKSLFIRFGGVQTISSAELSHFSWTRINWVVLDSRERCAKIALPFKMTT